MRKKTKTDSSSGSIITESGIIVPVEWNEQGRPVALALSTYKESEYSIDTTDVTGKALFNFLRRKVKIIGTLKNLVQNQQTITVLGFVVMKDTRLKHGNKN
ncbi:hypothetical protein ACFL7E_01275 [Thermodesulfobacteriota bacterium]